MKNKVLRDHKSSIAYLLKQTPPYRLYQKKLINTFLNLRTKEGNILNILANEISKAAENNETSDMCIKLFVFLLDKDPSLLDNGNDKVLVPAHYIFRLLENLPNNSHKSTISSKLYSLLHIIANSGYDFGKCFENQKCKEDLEACIKQEGTTHYQGIFGAIFSEFLVLKNALDRFNATSKEQIKTAEAFTIFGSKVLDNQDLLRELYKMKHGEELGVDSSKLPGSTILEYICSDKGNDLILEKIVEQYYLNIKYGVENTMHISHILRYLLEHGFDIKKMKGLNPNLSLLHVTKVGDMEMIKTLIDLGENVDVMSDDVRNTIFTPLMIAVVIGDMEIVKELLNSGAQLDKRNSDGDTALHFASKLGRTEILKTLINYHKLNKTKTFNLDIPNGMGIFPLYFAIQQKKPACAKILVNAGANFENMANERQLQELSASLIAKPYKLYEDNELDCIKIMLESDAFKVDLIKEEDLCELLAQFTVRGDINSVKALIDLGAPVKIDNELYSVMSKVKISLESRKFIKLFVENGFSIKGGLNDYQKELLLRLECKSGKVEFLNDLLTTELRLYIKFMVDAGQLPKIPYVKLAVESKHLRTAIILLDHNPYFSVQELEKGDQEKVLRYALRHAKKEHKNALVNIFKNSDIDYSQLERAVQKVALKAAIGMDSDNFDCLGKLLEQKIDFILLDKPSRNLALRKAVEYGKVELVQKLIELDPEIDQSFPDQNGKTNLDRATENGDNQMIELLQVEKTRKAEAEVRQKEREIALKGKQEKFKDKILFIEKLVEFSRKRSLDDSDIQWINQTIIDGNNVLSFAFALDADVFSSKEKMHFLDLYKDYLSKNLMHENNNNFIELQFSAAEAFDLNTINALDIRSGDVVFNEKLEDSMQLKINTVLRKCIKLEKFHIVQSLVANLISSDISWNVDTDLVNDLLQKYVDFKTNGVDQESKKRNMRGQQIKISYTLMLILSNNINEIISDRDGNSFTIYDKISDLCKKGDIKQDDPIKLELENRGAKTSVQLEEERHTREEQKKLVEEQARRAREKEHKRAKEYLEQEKKRAAEEEKERRENKERKEEYERIFKDARVLKAYLLLKFDLLLKSSIFIVKSFVINPIYTLKESVLSFVLSCIKGDRDR